MSTYFAKLTVICYFISTLPHPNEVSTFPIYVKEEIFVRKQFHKCGNAQMHNFTNALRIYWANAQIKKCKFTNAYSNHSISQKFVLNFQFIFSKR